MGHDLLPIGTVVKLADSTALVMVAGYLPVIQSRPDYVWDYSGFRFPIGYVDEEGLYVFDHEQIETVYAYGYKDIEQEMFMGQLNAARDRVVEAVKNGAAAGGDGEGSAPDGEKEE